MKFWQMLTWMEPEQMMDVARFAEDEVPVFTQGVPTHELEDIVTAEDCTAWVAEITRAVSLTEWHVSIEDTIGRSLTKVDIDALAALKRAQNEAWTSNQKIAEANRPKPK